MEKVYLQWSVVNWVTVVLMAALGYLLVGLVAQGIQKIKGQSGTQPSNG